MTPTGEATRAEQRHAPDQPRPDRPPQSGDDRPPRNSLRRRFLVWRAHVKANPTSRIVYRVAVTIVGVAFIVLAALTGWLPGPGGIPLALLGLAVLASEYAWARRLLIWARDQVKRFGHWTKRFPAWVRTLGGVAIIVVVLAFAWGVLVLLGVPQAWPDGIEHLLQRLPGVS